MNGKSKLRKNLVGPQVRKFRSRNGLSQSELAVKAQQMGWDISRDIVAKIEGQSRWVGDFELLLLGHLLGVPVFSLLPGAYTIPEILKNYVKN